MSRDAGIGALTGDVTARYDGRPGAGSDGGRAPFAFVEEGVMSRPGVGFVAGVATGSVLGIGASVVLALGLGVVSVPAWASTTVQAQQKSTSKVVLENARVRVKDALFVPGDKPPMHTHELAHVGVVITGGTLIFNYPDGKTETLELPAGGAGFRDANVTHQAINPGTSPVRVIEVELK